MAGEQAMDLATESPVSWSLGTALASSDSRIDKLAADGQRIGEVLKITTAQAVRLGSEFKNSQERAAQSARDWLTLLDRIYNNLTSQIDAVKQLTGLYQNLGKTMQSVQLPAAGLLPSDHGGTLIDAAKPVLGQAGKALGNSNDYQKILNDITIKANLLVAQPAPGMSPERAEAARQQTIASVPAIIARMSGQSGMGKAEAAGLSRDMLDAGVSFGSLETLAPLAARFSVGQNVDAKDTAALFRAMQNNGVQPGDMEKVLNAWIDQARNGGMVGIGDLAQMMPRLASALAASGQQGAEALIRAGQMVQERGQKLGTSTQISGDVQTAIEDNQLPALKPRTSSFNYVDEEVKKRRQDPAQRQKELDNSFTDLSTSIGDSLQPWVAPFVTTLTMVTNGFTKLTDAQQGLVGGVVALGAAVAGVLTTFGAIRKGKELLEAGKGLLRGNGEKGERGGIVSRVFAGLMGNTSSVGKRDGVVPVHVMNMPGNFASRGVPGDVISARRDNPPRDTRPPGTDGRTPSAGPAKTSSEMGAKGASSEASQGLGAGKDQTGAGSNSSPSVSTKAGDGAGASTNSTASPDTKRRPGAFSRMRAATGRTLGRLFAPARWLGAGLTAVDLLRSDTTRNEKAQILSTTAGGLGGSMAGAAAGAALGSVVPVVGTVVGGLIGAALGGMLGEAAGGKVGNALLSKKGQPSRPVSGRGGVLMDVAGSVASAVIIDGVATRMAPAADRQNSDSLPADVQSSVVGENGTAQRVAMTNGSTNNFAVTPNITINVQGIITNPVELVRVLQPEIQRMFDNFTARANAGTEMFDLPGGALVTT